MNKAQVPCKEYSRCRHFTGIQHKACKAGVPYQSVRDESGSPYRWPCLSLIGRPVAKTTCPKFDALTQAELDEEERVFREAADRAVAAVASGHCHECGELIEPSKIVGRCKYASCGHRVGQVMTGDDE